MLTLISATPSPYARKVRISLQEKKIPFTLQTEVPWDSITQTPQYNPLEKLPVLILNNHETNGPARTAETNILLEINRPKAIYESHHILDYLEAKYPAPALLPPLTSPEAIDRRLFAQRVQVVADGVCDALVLLFFEKQREAGSQSKEWTARQQRKVDGGVKAMAEWVHATQANGKDSFLLEDGFGLADIAVGSVLGYLSLRFGTYDWKGKYPYLETYWKNLETRESFKTTRPSPQTPKDRIV